MWTNSFQTAKVRASGWHEESYWMNADGGTTSQRQALSTGARPFGRREPQTEEEYLVRGARSELVC